MNNSIRDTLLSMKDEGYREFSSILMPSVNKERIIGIRIPLLRRLSSSMKKSGEYRDFLCNLPHAFHEENNLQAFLISDIDDFDECIKEIDRFLPYVDNWSTCDSLRPTCFLKNREALALKIDEWLASDHTYTVRFGVEMLMVHFLGDGYFKEEYLEKCTKIQSDEYYVNMMIAWYFATALAFRYENAVKYIEDKKLPVFVHNKTIEKAVQSFRVTDENKVYLRTLKIKN